MLLFSFLIGVLAAPALFCLLSGHIRFPRWERDIDVLIQKRWKHVRIGSMLLVMSWVVYGMTAVSIIPQYFDHQPLQVWLAGASPLALAPLGRLFYSGLIGLLMFIPLVGAYLLYLFSFAWCERRIRRMAFPLGGAVRVLSFEALIQLLPYALLFVFMTAGATPWIIAKGRIVQFNVPVAVVILAASLTAYLMTFKAAKAITRIVVPVQDDALEARVAELAAMAGVKAGKLFRIRAFGYPYAQAYALSDHNICLSDHVLDSFPPWERETVIAHELGHLKDMRTLVMRRYAVYISIVIALLLILPLCDVFPSDNMVRGLSKLAVPYGCLLLLIWQNKSSQRYELRADSFAASMVGEGLFVAAMERLHEVNLLPRRFDAKGRENMSHPSLEIRTNAVLNAKNMSADQQTER